MLRIKNFVTASIACLLAMATWIASAQEPPPKPPSNVEDLTQGLVDELIEPSAETKSEDASSQASETDSATALHNYMESIRSQMKSASDMLMRGSIDASTLRLQTQIVSGMDDLLKAIDESQRDGTSKTQESPGDEIKKTAKPPSSSESKKPRNDSMRDGSAPTDAQGADSEEGAIGQSKAEPTTSIVLDPEFLKSGVWGHMPERIRRNMQSNPIDRFLPKYRQQIESYYRRLSEGP